MLVNSHTHHPVQMPNDSRLPMGGQRQSCSTFQTTSFLFFCRAAEAEEQSRGRPLSRNLPCGRFRRRGHRHSNRHAPACKARAPFAFKALMIHGSAIHITYRISLRSSSVQEPRHPLLRVVFRFVSFGRRTPSSKAEGRRPLFPFIDCHTQKRSYTWRQPQDPASQQAEPAGIIEADSAATTAAAVLCCLLAAGSCFHIPRVGGWVSLCPLSVPACVSPHNKHNIEHRNTHHHTQTGRGVFSLHNPSTKGAHRGVWEGERGGAHADEQVDERTDERRRVAPTNGAPPHCTAPHRTAPPPAIHTVTPLPLPLRRNSC